MGESKSCIVQYMIINKEYSATEGGYVDILFDVSGRLEVYEIKPAWHRGLDM